MKYKWVFLISIYFAVSFCSVVLAEPLIFIGQDKENIKDYLNNVKHIPDGFMLYTSIQYMDGLDSPAIDRGSGIQHAQFLLSQFPNKPLQIGLYMVDAMDGVLAGEYDQNIEKLAQWVRERDQAIYLRIGYEFDLPQNNYDPKLYKATFKYIVDYLRRLNVSNVEYVWHTFSYSPPKKMEWWYPGDDYVDWIGLSYFNSYNSNLPAIAQYAKMKNKPLMLAEASPFKNNVSEGEKTWDVFFKRMFQFIDEFDVDMICYANSNWDEQPMFSDENWGDGRIQKNSYIKEQWLKAIGQ